MKIKTIKILNIILWVFIGLWYVPVIFPDYGGINCADGPLPDGQIGESNGFCADVYFQKQWWLILIRTALTAAALWAVMMTKKNKQYETWYPYAIAGLFSVSIIIRNIGSAAATLIISAISGLLFWAILTVPWWGSKLILKPIMQKIKKLR
jgi:branched-subunit amino acid transport protein